MKIAILGGGGAMGGIFGGYLARAGNDVTLIDVSKAAVQAINDNGLTIEEKDGSQPVIQRAGQRRSGERRPGRPHHQFREMLSHRGGRPGCSADDRQGHGGAQPAEWLGQRAAHRLDRWRGPRAGRPHLSWRHAARAGPRQASGRRHDLSRRAQRQADRASQCRRQRLSRGRHRNHAVRQDPERGLEEARPQRLHVARRRAAAFHVA